MDIQRKAVENGILLIALVFFTSSTYLFVSGTENAVSTDKVFTADIKVSPSRSPATVTSRQIPKPDPGYIPYQTRCEHTESFETNSGKIRIIGPLCGLGAGAVTDVKDFRFTIANNTNMYTATVFQDYKTHSFSTDFIPLQNGDNNIQIQFSYGKRAPASLIELNIKRIIKN